MIFQFDMQKIVDFMEEYRPFILASLLLVGGMILLKIALAITKAESNTNMKKVAGSFFIQFGITLFISLPMLLDMLMEQITGSYNDYDGPNPGLIAMTVIISIFIDLNITNAIHKTGLKRSFVVAILILGPIIGSTYLIFSNLGIIISF